MEKSDAVRRRTSARWAGHTPGAELDSSWQQVACIRAAGVRSGAMLHVFNTHTTAAAVLHVSTGILWLKSEVRELHFQHRPAAIRAGPIRRRHE